MIISRQDSKESTPQSDKGRGQDMPTTEENKDNMKQDAGREDTPCIYASQKVVKVQGCKIRLRDYLQDSDGILGLCFLSADIEKAPCCVAGSCFYLMTEFSF